MVVGGGGCRWWLLVVVVGGGCWWWLHTKFPTTMQVATLLFLSGQVGSGLVRLGRVGSGRPARRPGITLNLAQLIGFGLGRAWQRLHKIECNLTKFFLTHLINYLYES